MERSSIWTWPAEFLSGLHALARVAWALALLSLTLWFGLAGWAMSGSDAGLELSSIGAVATQTQFGRVSLARLAVLTLAAVCLFSSREKAAAKAGPAWMVAALVLAMVNLLMLALTGHAAATPGRAGLFRMLVDALHLAATSIWPGGLVCFGLLLRCILRSQPGPPLTVAAGATQRFSTASLMAVAALSATGLTMSFFFLNQARDLWTSAYGRLLTAKVLVFFAMVAIGAWNLLVLRRKLGRQAQPGPSGRSTAAASALLRNVLWEIVLGAAVLVIVAALGLTGPPAR
jgi:putative copper resistance protein D